MWWLKEACCFFSLASVYGQVCVCVCLHAPHTVLQVIISRQFWHLPHLLLTGKLSNVFPEQESLQGRWVLQVIIMNFYFCFKGDILVFIEHWNSLFSQECTVSLSYKRACDAQSCKDLWVLDAFHHRRTSILSASHLCYKLMNSLICRAHIWPTVLCKIPIYEWILTQMIWNDCKTRHGVKRLQFCDEEIMDFISFTLVHIHLFSQL